VSARPAVRLAFPAATGERVNTALVVGGGAASGRAIIRELRARGFDVTVYNSGRHNRGLGSDLEFVQGDPHFVESIRETLGSRSWDVAVVTYGRVRLFAEELRGRVGQLVTVSGMPVVATRAGLPLTETDRLVTHADEPAGMTKIAAKIAIAEAAVLQGAAAGHYAGTVVRYPYVYGPHAVVPMEWHVVKRCLDRRRRWILRSGGLAVTGRCASPNAGALIGKVLDRPLLASGNVYHAADDRQFTQREWIEMIASLMAWEFEYVDLPTSIARPGCSSAPLAGEDPFVLTAADMSAGRLRHHVPTAEKARAELGLAQGVDPFHWMEETVRYQLAHPPRTDGSLPSLSPSDFDYRAEDELLAWWDATVPLAPRSARAVTRRHPYDHPQAARAQRAP
jgi:nucleoside-diphosphate-sugar epimerase